MEALIIVCRDIPGEHLGGPECWCLPYEIDPFDEVAVAKLGELILHPERQADA